MKQSRWSHFLIMLFPGMLIGILVSFLIGMWYGWDTLLKWEIALLIGVGIAGLLTFSQTRRQTTTNDQQ